MALLFNNTNLLRAPLTLHSIPLSSTKQFPNYSSISVRCSSTNQQSDEVRDSDQDEPKKKKRLSEQSSWETKDSDGKDYLYRLGAEADNMNIAVGARAGVIDSLFAGNFLGKDSDIVFDYRQKVTRSFQYLQGDYYIAPVFLDKVGVWGGKGQGKTFQTELIFQAMGIEPVIMSAGELESERAGEPGKLIRERYRTASQVVQNQGKMSVLMINDIDAGLGRFGNDFSTMYAPLIRDGRMEKFYWQPTQEDIVNIVCRMYEKDGITKDEVATIVNTFPNQALDFYGAMRSRTYDQSILKWVEDSGGAEDIGRRFLRQRKKGELPVFIPPEQTLEALIESGHSLTKEQMLIMESKLSKEYMKNMDEE